MMFLHVTFIFEYMAFGSTGEEGGMGGGIFAYKQIHYNKRTISAREITFVLV